MWLDRHLERLTRHHGPIVFAAGEEFGAAHVLAGLGVKGTPVAWLEIAPHERDDGVNVGNKLGVALRRALGTELIPSALPYQTVVRTLARDSALLGPLWLALSGAEHHPELAGALLDLHHSEFRIVLEGARSPETTLPRDTLLIGESELALTPDEALAVADGELGDEIAEMLCASDGALERFLLALNERLGRPAPLRPSPDGPRFIPGSESEAEPRALLAMLLEQRRSLPALELAVRSFPERVPEVLARIGRDLHARGLHGRMWALLEHLPAAVQSDERVLFWRLSSAFRLGKIDRLAPAIEAHLKWHESPELRAMYAGATLPPAQARREARRAYDAARTPLTAYHWGRQADPAQGVEILTESVRLAESVGDDYAVVRNAGALSARHLHLGEYREAITWGGWALAEFERRHLGDGGRRARIVNTWAYARILAGETAGLEELLLEQEEIWAQAHPVLARTYRGTLADLLMSLGRPAEALVHYRLVYDSSDRPRIGRAALGLTRALVDLGEIAAAKRVADEATDLTRGEEAIFRAPALLAGGVACSFTDPREASTLLSGARRAFAHAPAADLQAQLALHELFTRLQLEGVAGARRILETHRALLRPLSGHGLRLLSGPEGAFREVWELLADDPPQLELRFLGRSEVWFGSQRVHLSQLLAEILALLALAEQPLDLGMLEFRLYGDGGHRQALKVAVARLRKAVPISAHPYRIAVPYRADFVELEAHLRCGQIGEAIDLYRGPLLPGSEIRAIREHDEVMIEALRESALAQRDVESLLQLQRLCPGDLQILETALEAVGTGDPRAPLIRARATRALLDYGVEA